MQLVFIHHHLPTPLGETGSGLSHSSICHGPQTVEHGSPYLLQEQRSVLQAVEQLQCMIFNRLSGAAFIVDITGTSRLS